MVPCNGKRCMVQVAETTYKRQRLLRYIVLSSLAPTVLIALATLVIVWFGVKRGLEPLDQLSEEIKAALAARPASGRGGGAPEEAKPLVGALNALLEEVAEANLNQQRFLANAAHQLRTPLAGLQAHTELALAQPVPRPAAPSSSRCTSRRCARRGSPTSCSRWRAPSPAAGLAAGLGPVDLGRWSQGAADEWVHRAMARDLDLGFDLSEARVRGDAFLLREALANLVHNSLEHTPAGGHVTVRTERAQRRRPPLARGRGRGTRHTASRARAGAGALLPGSGHDRHRQRAGARDRARDRRVARRRGRDRRAESGRPRLPGELDFSVGDATIKA